jgi:hypothetical protein
MTLLVGDLAALGGTAQAFDDSLFVHGVRVLDKSTRVK